MEQFDFEKRKIQSPYTVPQGFFEQMEERLVARVAERRFKDSIRIFPIRLRYAAAAAVVAIVIGTASFIGPSHNATDEYDEIAQLFQQLSPEDQNSMLESFQDDIFMND